MRGRRSRPIALGSQGQKPKSSGCKALNSLIGMRSYEQVRRILGKATQELTVLDTLLN
jgi:hypothetical protein